MTGLSIFLKVYGTTVGPALFLNKQQLNPGLKPAETISEETTPLF